MALFLNLNERGQFMTIDIFIYLFTIGSLFASLLTQAAKKAFPKISCNILALVNAVIVGILGMLCVYTIMDIAFTFENIIYIVFMAVCIWMGSMIGYDKIIQTMKQLKE